VIMSAVDISVEIAPAPVDGMDTSSDIHCLSVGRGMIGVIRPQPSRPRTLTSKQLSPPSTDAKTTDDKHYSEMNNLKSNHLAHSVDDLAGSLAPSPRQQPHKEAG
jgi:hypothetical protein